LRRRFGIGQVCAAPPNPVVLLGNVGQIQEVGERASQWNGGVDQPLLELGGERLEIAVVACARCLGHRADAFDGFEQLRALDTNAHSRRAVVADYIFEKDKLFACLNLSDAELDIYNRYYDLFHEQLPTPDLVIYLQATPDVLSKRVRRKKAPGEKAISDDYLEEVVKAYEHFFFHYTASDLLVVNTNEIDFVEHNQDLQELLRKLDEPIRGTQYFLPLGGSPAGA
jgi:broad-specificity NMP kinase